MIPSTAAADAGDRGAGLVGSIAGVTVFLLFLLLAVQAIVGLYATSTLRSVLHDTVSRAADRQPGSAPPDLAQLASEARSSLGGMGERSDISLRLADDDGDGVADAVVGDAVAVPPRLMPRSLGGMVGFDEIHASVRVRVERLQ